MVVTDRLDRESNPLLRIPLKEQRPVAEHAVSQQCRCVVQDNDIESLARHFLSQASCQSPDRLASILSRELLGDEHGDVEVAVFAGASPGAAPEQKSKAHLRDLGQGLRQTCGSGIHVLDAHKSTVPYTHSGRNETWSGMSPVERHRRT